MTERENRAVMLLGARPGEDETLDATVHLVAETYPAWSGRMIASLAYRLLDLKGPPP